MTSIINRFYEPITGGTVDKLGDIVNDVNQNLDEKAALREMREKMLLLQEAIDQGDNEQAGKLILELRGLADRAGIDKDDPIYAMLYSVDAEAIANRTEKFSSEELEAWDGFFSDFELALGLELDQRADIGARQQTELNFYSSQLRQAEQAMSDIDSRWSNAVKEVVANMKA